SVKPPCARQIDAQPRQTIRLTKPCPGFLKSDGDSFGIVRFHIPSPVIITNASYFTLPGIHINRNMPGGVEVNIRRPLEAFIVGTKETAVVPYTPQRLNFLSNQSIHRKPPQ